MRPECRRRHPVTAENTDIKRRCILCRQLYTRVRSAQLRGKPLCSAGHSLAVSRYSDLDGNCIECRDYPPENYREPQTECPNGHDTTAKGSRYRGHCQKCRNERRAESAARKAALRDSSVPKPCPEPPATWLDWVQVHNAIGYIPLSRPMTSHEILCLMATIIARGLSPTPYGAAAYIRNVLGIEITSSKAEAVWGRWAPKNNIQPRTIEDAVLYENTPDGGVEKWFASSSLAPCSL